MALFFNMGGLGGNPFSTPVGQRIEQATDATLASENWALNMEICDLINESSETARDAMKAIRKRLQQNAGKNPTVIMYTLTVLETCVKNCGKALHVLVANKEFIQELVKLIGPKNDPPAIVQEKVLNLIQVWAEAFKNQSDLNGVVQVYQELKNKGIEFPATDLDSLAPIYTPQRSVPETTPPAIQPTSPQHATQMTVSPGTNLNGPVTLTPEQTTRLQAELDIISLNMSILGEMLTELKPGQEEPSEYKLLTELTQTCREMQGRIVELIGRINHDELTAELLRLNDELNNLFLRHQRYEKNRDPKTSNPPSAILGAAMGVPLSNTNREQGKDALIDLSDGAAGGADGLSSQFTGLDLGTASSQLSKIDGVAAITGATSKTANDADEFDMLAQSRNTGPETNKPMTGVVKDIPSIETHAGSKQPPAEVQPTKESEFDEMAAWLSNSKDIGQEETLTSTEFDKFLAERAAAAENLPTVAANQAGGDTEPNRPKKTQSKKDDANLLSI